MVEIKINFDFHKHAEMIFLQSSSHQNKAETVKLLDNLLK